MLTLNTLHNLDCMEGMSQFPDKFFDLAVVDPPYYPEVNLRVCNGNYYGAPVSRTGVIRHKYHLSSAWAVPGQPYYDELCRVSVNQIIWGINYFKFDGTPPGRIVWDKCRNWNGSFSDAEIASCSIGKGVRIFRFMWDGMLQGDMKNKERKIHITQKPVELYRWIYAKYANQGDKILDTHAGSASSFVAAYELGYDYIGFEIDPDYHRLATERVNRAMSQAVMRLEV